MIFSKVVITKLQNLFNKSKKIQSNALLTECLKETLEVFEITSIKQVIKELHDQRDFKYERLVILRNKIEQEYDEIENELQLDCDNPYALAILPFRKIEVLDNLEDFLRYRQAVLRDALTHILYEAENPEGLYKVDKKCSLSCSLLNKECFHPAMEQVINDAIETNTVVIFKKEYEHYKHIISTINNIQYIKHHSMGIGSADTNRLRMAIQDVHNYFLQTIEKVVNLEILPIDKISYSFTDDKVNSDNAVLRIQINDAQCIKIQGIKAQNVHTLFSSPLKNKVFTEDPRQNEKIRKSFEDFNISFCEEYYVYGFVYGFEELIISDKYNHRINFKFADVIQKK